MYMVEDFVIAIYCLIEDELYPAFWRGEDHPVNVADRRAGRECSGRPGGS